MKRLSVVTALVAFLATSFSGVNSFTVIIDPGHGGVYTGTVSASGRVVEKIAVLHIAKELARLLEKEGIQSVLTRTEDVELDAHDLIEDLKKRAEVTKKNNGDIFVSLHLNSNPNVHLAGYEVYVPFTDELPLGSYQLAQALHFELTRGIEPVFGGANLGNQNAVDRGIRAAKYNVLRRATCPAALVELAYLSHVPTAESLEKEENLNHLAQVVCKGIVKYKDLYSESEDTSSSSQVIKEVSSHDHLHSLLARVKDLDCTQVTPAEALEILKTLKSVF